MARAPGTTQLSCANPSLRSPDLPSDQQPKSGRRESVCLWGTALGRQICDKKPLSRSGPGSTAEMLQDSKPSIFVYRRGVHLYKSIPEVLSWATCRKYIENGFLNFKGLTHLLIGVITALHADPAGLKKERAFLAWTICSASRKAQWGPLLIFDFRAKRFALSSWDQGKQEKCSKQSFGLIFYFNQK